MSVEERLRGTLGRAADGVAERPGDLDATLRAGDRRARRVRLAASASGATVVLLVVVSAAAIVGQQPGTPQIGPIDGVVAEGTVEDGSWQTTVHREDGQLCLELEHTSIAAVTRCLEPLDEQLADLAPAGSVDVDGQAVQGPGVVGTVSSAVAEVVVAFSNGTVTTTSPRPVEGWDDRVVAAGFDVGQQPREVRLYGDEGQLLERWLLLADGTGLRPPLEALHRADGLYDRSVDPDEPLGPDDANYRTAVASQFAHRLYEDEDYTLYLYIDPTIQSGPNPFICLSADVPSAGLSRCTEVDQPPQGIFLQEQVRRGPLLISVVTDGYDGEVPGQRAAPNLYLSDELE